MVEQNRCPTAGLDPAQPRSWCERASERASGYSLVAFDGMCPDEHLDNFVAAMPIMNTAPRTESTEDHAPSAEPLPKGGLTGCDGPQGVGPTLVATMTPSRTWMVAPELGFTEQRMATLVVVSNVATSISATVPPGKGPPVSA